MWAYNYLDFLMLLMTSCVLINEGGKESPQYWHLTKEFNSVTIFWNFAFVTGAIIVTAIDDAFGLLSHV